MFKVMFIEQLGKVENGVTEREVGYFYLVNKGKGVAIMMLIIHMCSFV